VASYNKGTTGGESLGAKDLAGRKVWAFYPYWEGSVDTKLGPSKAVRAEVYELTDDGAAVRFGNATFFQTTFLRMPLEEWSVGMVHAPDDDQRYYSIDWPEGLAGVIDDCMDSLPEHPELPELAEEPFPHKPAGFVAIRPPEEPSGYDDEPF
jgi:hypothetical protein